MGLYITGKDDKRSELQSKIIADLQRKMHESSLDEGKPSEQRILENQHETRTAGVVIGLLLATLFVVAVFVFTRV